MSESKTAVPAEMEALIEATLFAAGDPLSLDVLSAVTQTPLATLQQWMNQLQATWAGEERRGTYLRVVDETYALATKPTLTTELKRLYGAKQLQPLSKAAYEVLAVVAYNQPVTRAQIEAVRGVQSDSLLQRLMERELVEEVGRLEGPGRPMLFGTTEKFLEAFGLSSIQALPPMELLMYSSLRELEDDLAQAGSGEPAREQLSLDHLLGVHTES